MRLLAGLLLLASAQALASTPVRDDWGRVLRFERPPSRIVSLAPHATELLFAAGAGPQLVAVDANSDEPAQARALPRIPSLPAPDAERLLALRPDLVVLWGAGSSAGTVARLESLGIRVFVSDPRRLDDVAATLRRFASLSADPARARAQASAVEREVAALRARFAARVPVKVFLQVWSRPLVTLSDRDPVGDSLRACGAVNVFADSVAAAPQVGVELVLQAGPRLVAVLDVQGGDEPWSSLGLLAPRGPFAIVHLDAVLQRPVPRMLPVLTRLCEAVDRQR